MSAHEHITHIGNTANNWRMSREDAIRRIDSQQEPFYTVDRSTGRKMYIGVVRGDGFKASYPLLEVLHHRHLLKCKVAENGVGSYIEPRNIFCSLA
jgi:Protein of unknown function (DUF3892)